MFQRADAARYLAFLALFLAAVSLALTIYNTVVTASNTSRLNSEDDDESSSESSPMRLQTKRDSMSNTHIVYGSAITEGGKVSGRMITGGIVNILSGKEVRIETAENIFKELTKPLKKDDIFPIQFVNRQSETDVRISISDNSGVINMCEALISRGTALSTLLQIQDIEKETVVLYC
jgi:hypothetical protein